MDRTSVIFFSMLFFVVATFVRSQYTDDSDYDDFTIYQDSENKILDSQEPDDFYIIPEESSHKETIQTIAKNLPKIPEKTYQYTKHRIPGYDYDELDFTEDAQRCDDRSVWTHCLCQFTCSSQNSVDCFAPCTSGCECKEDFVYDEESESCVYPDQCSRSIEI